MFNNIFDVKMTYLINIQIISVHIFDQAINTIIAWTVFPETVGFKLREVPTHCI